MLAFRIVVVWIGLAAVGCGDATPPGATPGSPTGPTTPPAPEASPSAGLPGPTFCEDMAGLVESARTNFPDLRRTDKPVSVDHNPGFEATVVLANTVACRILTSEAPYPDAYECDLAAAESAVKAKEVIDRWAPVVGACPQLATWKPTPPNDFGRGWELDTGDNHQLVVRLFTAGDDRTRPTLTIRLNEI